MGRDLLSREELALLLSEDLPGEPVEAHTDQEPFSPGDFGRLASTLDKVLMEVGHAWTLSLGTPVELLPCRVALVSPATLGDLGSTAVAEVAFTGAIKARGYCLFPLDLAREVARLVVGSERVRETLDDEGRRALGEAVSFLVAELRSQVQRLTGRRIATTTARIYVCGPTAGPDHERLVEARAGISLGGQTRGELYVWCEMDLATALAGSRAVPLRAVDLAGDAAAAAPMAGDDPAAAVDREAADEEPTGPVLSVEVGRCRTTQALVEGLAIGGVVTLDRLAGEPVDILVDGQRVGRGEIVVEGDRLAVRVTSLDAGGSSGKEESIHGRSDDPETTD